jgi:hypothetical protein
MADLVHSKPTRLEDEEFGWMTGRSVSNVHFNEPETWSFLLSGGGAITTDGGAWRLSSSSTWVTGSQDHAQRFGHSAPIDAAELSLTALQGTRIVGARVRGGPPDLEVRFGNGLLLEVLALSSGYECWQVRDPTGRCIVVHGNRDSSTWQEPTRRPGR